MIECWLLYRAGDRRILRSHPRGHRRPPRRWHLKERIRKIMKNKWPILCGYLKFVAGLFKVKLLTQVIHDDLRRYIGGDSYYNIFIYNIISIVSHSFFSCYFVIKKCLKITWRLFELVMKKNIFSTAKKKLQHKFVDLLWFKWGQILCFYLRLSIVLSRRQWI